LRGDGEIAQVDSRWVHVDLSEAEGRWIAACPIVSFWFALSDDATWAKGVPMGAFCSSFREFLLYDPSSSLIARKTLLKDSPFDNELGHGLLEA
jgi:hypothetical protein